MVNKEGEEFANLAVMNDAETQEDMIFRKFTGVDPEVGGEGMGAFYDKILVDRAKKLGKQYGSEVQKGRLAAEDYIKRMDQDAKGPTVWTMNLTDKLKKAAKDGLPYYVALPPIAAGVQRESERQQINQIQAQQNAQRINAQ